MIEFATQPLDQLNAFHSLRQHHAGSKYLHLRRMFSIDPMRARRMSLQTGSIMLDYSKNRITDQTLKLLTELADEARLGEWIDALLSGQYSHNDKAISHTALRNLDGKPFKVDGTDLMPSIESQLNRLSALTDELQHGNYLSASGKQITNVAFVDANGIPPGSKLAYKALSEQSPETPLTLHHFECANRLENQLAKLDPSVTLVAINTTSFDNNHAAVVVSQLRQWISAAHENKSGHQDQLIIIADNTEAQQRFDLEAKQLFLTSGHIDQRYALWSAAALSARPHFIKICPYCWH